MIGHQAFARACGDDGDGDAHQACGSITFLFWWWKVFIENGECIAKSIVTDTTMPWHIIYLGHVDLAAHPCL